MTNLNDRLRLWPQGGASGAQGLEKYTRLDMWATHIFHSTDGEPACHRGVLICYVQMFSFKDLLAALLFVRLPQSWFIKR